MTWGMTFDPRASACPDLTTEDNRTPIAEGMELFNYYDGKWGHVSTIDDDGWFRFLHDDGTSALLNGVRVSTVDPQHRPRPAIRLNIGPVGQQ